MTEKKIWNIRNSLTEHSEAVEKIAAEIGMSPLTAALLYNRGFTSPQDAVAFLRRESEAFYDPFLMKDMDRAADRILAAIDSGEKIIVYGDYDVDGVTAVSTLYLYLRSKGADVGYYIPSRESEGYGVNSAAVEKIASDGYTLLITVDTGITAVREVEFARSVGVDFVITDHHECQAVLPDACAVVDPHRPDCAYPFKELAGVGVVFKLICALESRLEPEDERYLHRLCTEYGDMVAVGTVADVMPLVGENRLIVSIGLRLIENGTRIGLAALCAQARGDGKVPPARGSDEKKKKVTSSLIGFTIAPRINAAGRIRDALMAVELFTTDNRTRAEEIAAMLCEINRERQNCENRILEEAYKQIEQTHDFERDRVIVISDEHWHHGVIGIVASKVTERFSLPSILVSFDGGRIGDAPSEDDIGKGSGRSITGMNLAKALSACGEHLEKFGGHEMAAGLSVRRGKLTAFKRAINAYAASSLKEEDLIPAVEADETVEVSDLTLETASELYLLEPYGVANPVPVFELQDAVISEISAIGANKHTRLTVIKDGKMVSAVYFGKNPAQLGLYAGDTVDLLFNLDINDFRGVQSVQLIVRDIRPCGAELEKRAHMLQCYENMLSDPDIPVSASALPSRTDFKTVYLYLRRELSGDETTVELYRLMKHTVGDSDCAYIKLRTILDAFEQSGIITYLSPISSGVCDCSVVLRINEMSGKAQLEETPAYIALAGRIASSGQ